eukprot:1716353-Amphidinium_carterae.1
MDDRPIVTTIPSSMETPLPKASSHSSIDSDSTIDRGQIDIVEQMMWKTVASPQCSPFVMERLHRAHYMETMPMSFYKSSTQFLDLEMLTHTVTTPTIDMGTFDPTWVTDAQLKQFRSLGTISGFKNALHGDSAHRHHRYHNKVDHFVNMATHHCWGTMNKRVFYGERLY